MIIKKIKDEIKCNICLQSPINLTEEHVPPKCVQKWKTLRVFKRYTGNVLYLREKAPGFIGDVYGGLSFKTTCDSCNNNLLAPYDNELKNLFDQIEPHALLAHKNYRIGQSDQIDFLSNTGDVLRSLLGHTLASYVITPTGTISNSVRNFVLNPSIELPDDFQLYYWFYKGLDIKVSNMFGFAFNENMSNSSFVQAYLKFWPLAFLVSSKKFDVLENTPGVFNGRNLFDTKAKTESVFPMSFTSNLRADWPEGGVNSEISGVASFNDEASVHIYATTLLKSKSLVRKIKNSRIT